MGTLKAPRNTPKLPLLALLFTLFIPKKHKKILILPFLRSPIIYKETYKAPRNNPKLPLFAPQIRKNCNIDVFEIANNFIVEIQLLEHRLARKNGNPQSAAEHPQTTFICSKNT